jgi:hypothetical protein
MFDLDLGYPDVLWVAGQYGRTMRGAAGGTSWKTMSGTADNRYPMGIVALSADSAVETHEAGRTSWSIPSTPIPDYSGTEWGTSNGMFGICLRALPGAVNTWPTTGSCATANGTNWRAVPLTASLPAATVGELATPTTSTASFRFGVNVAPGQSPGTYSAPIMFEVVAPSA